MPKPTPKKSKKRKVNITPQGIIHIKSSFNNIIITATNKQGQTISWSSAGERGFKGAKKSTPFAARQAASACAKTAYQLGLRKVVVQTKGIGPARDHAIRQLIAEGFEVTVIKDITPQPHGGCRPPRERHP